jgi:DNA-binding response OmpR family regulator
MSARCVMDCLPCEAPDSDTYNRIQMRRAVATRGDPNAEASFEGSADLLRVLIVDDHRPAADTLAMLVGVWGHEVRCAYDGTTGLALTASYKPDVVLLDIMMPNMNGLEFAKHVRQQARLDDCFLVAVTGRTDESHRLRCEEAGIGTILIKPVAPSILKTLLVWEFDRASRSRRCTAVDETLVMPLGRRTTTFSHGRKQSSDNVLHETVAM